MSFEFPTWAAFGIVGAAINAATMLLQEKFKVNGYALAFWNKVGTVAVVIPFVLYHGFPTNPAFYMFVFASASLYAISDVVYFGGIGKVGAGAVSRVLPASVIFSFLLWFVVEPASLKKYLAAPGLSAAIFGVLCLWVYFATHLRKCAVSMNAARIVWFVIFAAIVGPPIGKKALNLADNSSGVYAFVFFQALFMLSIWAFYYWLRKPVTSSLMRTPHAWRNGIGIGVLSGLSVILGVFALYYVDNPAYATAVSFLNAIMILGVYSILGRKNDGNIAAGIGMVICAAMLIILKSHIN